jgi:hypothetical protein
VRNSVGGVMGLTLLLGIAAVATGSAVGALCFLCILRPKLQLFDGPG